MKALSAWLGAALVIAVGTSSPGDVRASYGAAPAATLEVGTAWAAPVGDQDALDESKRAADKMSWRGVSGFRERVRAFSAELGIPVSVSESAAGLIGLRAGDIHGPTIVVIPGTEDDGLGAGWGPVQRGPRLEGGTGANSVDHLGPALEDAVNVLRRACRDAGTAGQLANASVLIVLGPGNRLAEAMDTRSPAQREAAFDLNFPWRWDEARWGHGKAAGPYPASRPDVLALSDLLLSEPRISSVVRADPAALSPHSAPASLAAFVKGRLKLDHRSPRAVGGLSAEIVGALRDLPELRWSKPVWRRMGANSWVVDLLLENVGSRPTGPSRGPAHELRLPRGIQLGVQVRGETYRWLACGAAPRAPVALQDRAIRRGVATLSSLGPGEALRVRLVLAADGRVAGQLPVLDITAASGRALGADLLGLTPPASR